MDEVTFLNLIIAIGTILLVCLGLVSWRSRKQRQQRVRSKELHAEYLKLSNIIEIIREPNYLKTDPRDFSVAVHPWSLHIGETDFEAIDRIVRHDNPQIETHTCDAWKQVVILRKSRYPSSSIVFEVNGKAFGNFEHDVKSTLDKQGHILRKYG